MFADNKTRQVLVVGLCAASYVFAELLLACFAHSAASPLFNLFKKAMNRNYIPRYKWFWIEGLLLKISLDAEDRKLFYTLLQLWHVL